MHLGAYVLHPSPHWGCGPDFVTDTGTNCDPRRIRRSNNTLMFGTSSVCCSMQVWYHLAGRLGYCPDSGSMCWGSVPNIAAADCCRGCRRCLFFVTVCSSSKPDVLAVLSTVGVVGVIVHFVVVVVALWGESTYFLGRA